MRVYPEAEMVSDGDTFAPHELNAELRSIIGELNGNLDRENVPDATLDPSHLALDAYQSRTYFMSNTQRSVYLDAGMPLQQLVYVPDDAGDDLTFTVDCLDGYLSIESVITIQDPGGQCLAYIVVLLDGQPIGRSQAGAGLAFRTHHLKCGAQVGAGPHIIDIKFGRMAARGSDTYNFRGRSVRIRHGKR